MKFFQINSRVWIWRICITLTLLLFALFMTGTIYAQDKSQQPIDTYVNLDSISKYFSPADYFGIQGFYHSDTLSLFGTLIEFRKNEIEVYYQDELVGYKKDGEYCILNVELFFRAIDDLIFKNYYNEEE